MTAPHPPPQTSSTKHPGARCEKSSRRTGSRWRSEDRGGPLEDQRVPPKRCSRDDGPLAMAGIVMLHLRWRWLYLLLRSWVRQMFSRHIVFINLNRIPLSYKRAKQDACDCVRKQPLLCSRQWPAKRTTQNSEPFKFEMQKELRKRTYCWTKKFTKDTNRSILMVHNVSRIWPPPHAPQAALPWAGCPPAAAPPAQSIQVD